MRSSTIAAVFTMADDHSAHSQRLLGDRAQRLASPRKFELLDKYLSPVTTAPVLRTVNGVGTKIEEPWEDKDLSPKFWGFYFRTYFLLVLPPPKLLAVYLVSRPETGGLRKWLREEYIFHGSLTPQQFSEIYPGILERQKRTYYLMHYAAPVGLIVLFVLGYLFTSR